MRITINIYYTGTNGAARKFAEEMLSSGVVEAIRKEDGNLRYEYFYSVEDQETVLLIDSWKSQKALDDHHKSALMGKITSLRDKYHLHMVVERYVLKDKIPKKDLQYIKIK